MSKKTAKTVAFELPEGIDENMQVVPPQLLDAIVNILNEVPAKMSRDILNALQNAVAQKQVTNIAEYLKSLHDAKA